MFVSVENNELLQMGSNLKSHIEQEHPEWPEAYQAFLNRGKGPMDIYVKRASKKAENLHSWIEWVVQGMHPPTFVEKIYKKIFQFGIDLSKNCFQIYGEGFLFIFL